MGHIVHQTLSYREEARGSSPVALAEVVQDVLATLGEKLGNVLIEKRFDSSCFVEANSVGGATHYSNELWTQNLGGGHSPTHFVYDLYFMIDKPGVSQALEFDVNQTINNTRWVFGTECNFKGSGKPVGEWDVWDGVKGWQPTSAPCAPFPANQWIHLVWTFERVGNQVHYVSLQVDNNAYPLNLYYSNQPNWSMGQINVAFQMDGDANQTPYDVWLDKVNLTVY